jgi:hypothetical protein
MSRYLLPKSLMPFLAAMAAAAQPAAPVTKADPRAPVLVELFTSEGCSSCPPADELLERLARTQPVASAQVIALEWHVDYWNQLGWADPYSSAEATARQQAYSNAFQLDGVYTPQVVIDGQRQLVPSPADLAREITGATRRSKAQVQLSLGPRSGSSVQVRVQMSETAGASSNDEVELWLAITEDNLQTQVLRGENAGRRLNHAAVVRRFRRLARLPKAAKEPTALTSNEDLDSRWVRANLRATAFLQEQRSRRVVGAATIPLEAP